MSNFFMLITGVSEENGMVVVSGTIERGQIATGDKVESLGLKKRFACIVSRIKKSGNDTAEACQGDAVELFLQKIALEDVMIGDALVISGGVVAVVEDVFEIGGKGTVAIVTLNRGILRIGADVKFIGSHEAVSTCVLGIEMHRKIIDEAYAGDSVGVLLRYIHKNDIERGDFLLAD